MKFFVLLFFQICLVSGNKTFPVDSSIGAPALALVDPMPISAEVGCEGGGCNQNTTSGEVQPSSTEEDDDYDYDYGRFDIGYFLYGTPEIQEACKYEAPEDQFKRVDVENKKEVDFEGFLRMTDNCRRAYRKFDFDRIDTNDDGKLSWDEWIAEQNKIKEELKRLELQWTKSEFKYADRNKDKSLNLKEFKKYLKFEDLDKKNAEQYLESLGGKMNLDQFIEFKESTPNETFPYKYDSYEDDYDYEYDSKKKDKKNKKNKNKKNKNKNKKNKNKNKKNKKSKLTPVTPVVQLPVDDSGMRPAVMEPVVEEHEVKEITTGKPVVQKLLTLDNLLKGSENNEPAIAIVNSKVPAVVASSPKLD